MFAVESIGLAHSRNSASTCRLGPFLGLWLLSKGRSLSYHPTPSPPTHTPCDPSSSYFLKARCLEEFSTRNSLDRFFRPSRISQTFSLVSPPLPVSMTISYAAWEEVGEGQQGEEAAAHH
jgi:hypothetical protein